VGVWVVCVVVVGSAGPNLEKQAECFTGVSGAPQRSRSAGEHRRSHGNIGNVSELLLVSQDSMVCGFRGVGQMQLGGARKGIDHGWQEGEEWCSQHTSIAKVYAHARARAHTHTHTSISIYIHTYMYMHIHTHTQTHTPTHLRKASAVPPCPIAPEEAGMQGTQQACTHRERRCARVSRG
jgi:hypothetical protein